MQKNDIQLSAAPSSGKRSEHIHNTIRHDQYLKILVVMVSFLIRPVKMCG